MELQAQEEADGRTLEHLKYRLGPVLGELRKKYKRFTRDVWEEYNLIQLTKQFEFRREKGKVIVTLRYDKPASAAVRRRHSSLDQVDRSEVDTSAVENQVNAAVESEQDTTMQEAEPSSDQPEQQQMQMQMQEQLEPNGTGSSRQDRSTETERRWNQWTFDPTSLVGIRVLGLATSSPTPLPFESSDIDRVLELRSDSLNPGALPLNGIVDRKRSSEIGFGLDLILRLLNLSFSSLLSLGHSFTFDPERSVDVLVHHDGSQIPHLMSSEDSFRIHLLSCFGVVNDLSQIRHESGSGEVSVVIETLLHLL